MVLQGNWKGVWGWFVPGWDQAPQGKGQCLQGVCISLATYSAWLDESDQTHRAECERAKMSG